MRRSASSRRTLGPERGRYGSVPTAPPPAVASPASSPPCCQPLRRAGRFSPFLSAPLCRAASHALPTPRVPAPGAPGREWAARRRGRLRQVTNLRGSAAQSPHHLPRPAGWSAVVRGRGRGRGQAGAPQAAARASVDPEVACSLLRRTGRCRRRPAGCPASSPPPASFFPCVSPEPAVPALAELRSCGSLPCPSPPADPA